jgi:protein-disulfide isomerase
MVCLGVAFMLAAPAKWKASQLVPVNVNVSASELTLSTNIVLGNATSRNKLVMFGDYQCPPCHAAWPKVVRLAANRPNLAVYFCNYPLTQIHPLAFDAAVAAEAAKEFGLAREVHQRLITMPLTDGIILGIYKKFGKSVESEEDQLRLKKKVGESIMLAEKLGVQGTPAFFYIDGEKRIFSLVSLDSLP